MDIIQQCLALVPVPYLAQAFSTLQFIWTSVSQAQVSNGQLRVLAFALSELLQTLDAEYRSGRLASDATSTPLDRLGKLLEDVARFVQKQCAQPFLKTLFTKDDRIARIDAYHRQINALVGAFQIAALLRVNHWQSENDTARVKDQQDLIRHLNDLEANQNKLLEALNAQHSNMLAMMASLQRRLEQHSPADQSTDQERHFFSYSLQFLSRHSGKFVNLENWMVTPMEVEFGQQIGAGGFGQVFRGSWNKIDVAIKVLRSGGDVMPDPKVIRREIDTWSKLMHPHILQFLGANILDDKPFIVMPFLKNGNARDYIYEHPDCNRVKILHHMALGLVYLHAHQVVHGDLKALNVLIDDGEKAVLCDFGLSQVKVDVASRTTKKDAEVVVGSRNWMAPELLMGGALKKPCDIYAYGMTIYEIYTNETPLGNINYGDFFDFVVNRNVRPLRPDQDELPQLTDNIWQLAEECWAKNPRDRPDAGAVCDFMAHLLNATDNTDLPPPFRPPARDSLLRPIPRLRSFEPAQVLHGHPGMVLSAAFSPDGKRIVSGCSERTIILWDLRTGQVVLGPLLEHRAEVHSVAFSPDGTSIVSGSEDTKIRVWNADTGRVRLSCKGDMGAVWSVVFSPDGKYIASGTNAGVVQVWDAKKAKVKPKSFKGHSKPVASVAFSSNGKKIVSGSWDKTLIAWDVSTGAIVLGPLSAHTGCIASVAFSPDGGRIISGSFDHTIRVWDAQSGEVVFCVHGGHTDRVCSVAFSRNGNMMVSGSSDRTVRVWDANTGAAISDTLSWHTGSVESVGFSPNSDLVVSSSCDGTIRTYARPQSP